MTKLSSLLAPLLASDPDVTGITLDSRAVRPGDLFAALPGRKMDGRDFIGAAIEKGAVAILAPTGTTLDRDDIALITDDEPRRRLAHIAARFYGAQPAIVAAVTGTNGKTSVVNFTRQIWSHLGIPAASLGTLGLISPHKTEKGSLTTPDSVSLHRDLAELAAAGVDHLAIEASSDGLAQFRLEGVSISAAAFTNLTRDHLDTHGTMLAYWAAKKRLFTEVMPPCRTAVINADSDLAEELTSLCRLRGQKVLSFGFRGDDIRIVSAVPAAQGQTLELSVQGHDYKLYLPLAGAFQASNATCALGLALATGADAAAAVAALSRLEGVPGRLQKVAVKANGAAVYVDYAHTPDALETALNALRPHVGGKLVALFGCGGDRDPGKRPQMGAIAAKLADKVYVTDDNPRSEEPAAIRAQIMPACPSAVEIGDRRQAILQAVLELDSGDVLVLAGKGHESGQIIKGQVFPFDDAVEARAAVEQTL
ncbi:MAG TPA: UDP-N-acetylmuramoyl-L-alanyl-D-glutamate--2,6-diaminopimelate ligase [Candidatus Sulfotelmatobacter sp.]|nr:UDP-N-acetylmuramoyl-L-alanyl-D-glutamate--2,6-diaminopimelate ligase [Candidatus Sulfotelmatobacter sp.]